MLLHVHSWFLSAIVVVNNLWQGILFKINDTLKFKFLKQKFGTYRYIFNLHIMERYDTLYSINAIFNLTLSFFIVFIAE